MKMFAKIGEMGNCEKGIFEKATFAPNDNFYQQNGLGYAIGLHLACYRVHLRNHANKGNEILILLL